MMELVLYPFRVGLKNIGIKSFEKELYERDVSRLLSSDPYYNHEVFNTESRRSNFA